MGFFTVGNLLTLGIVLVALLLYRSMDRRSRMLNNMKKYAEKLKDELTSYVEQREQGIKNLGIDIRVEQEAAAEIMNRIQTANEALEEKATAADRVEERLNAYDSTLEELVEMTVNVQENLNRIKEESVFIDETDRHINEARTSLQGLERGLGSLELRFERDNAESLLNLTEKIMTDVRSAISDLAVKAETIEHKVEEHDAVITSKISEHIETINNMEQGRAEALARDMNLLDKTLKDAVEQAGLNADKLEEATLLKLKGQAEEIVADVRYTVSDLNVEAEAAERRVEDHRDFINNKISEQLGTIDNKVTEHLEAINNKINEHRDVIDNKIAEHREAINSVDKSRTEALGRDMDIVSRTLKSAVEQAELNADKLEEATLFKLKGLAEEIVDAVRSTVSDLNVEADTAEQRVGEHRDFINHKITEHLEDIDKKITEYRNVIDNKITEHREAVNSMEQGRTEALARDMSLVDKTLKDAVDKAGLNADKLEEATLIRLKGQAEEIVSDVRSTISDLNVEAETAERRVGEQREIINFKITEQLETIDNKITEHLGTIDSKITEHRELIDNKIAEHRETVDNKITEHREAVGSVDKSRTEALARDMALVDKTLKDAVEQAGLNADKLEETTLIRLKGQAEEIVSAVRSTVSDLNNEAETAERKVGEHREFINIKITEHLDTIDNKVTEHLETISNKITEHRDVIDNKIAEHREAVDNKIAEHRETIDNKITEHQEFIGNKITEHREAVDSVEQSRAETLARDMALVESTLKNAVEQATLNADKIEGAALTRLKDQAEEIVSDLKSTVSDLNVEAETAERKVGEHREFIDFKITEHLEAIDNKITEHREAVTRMEQGRTEALARDMALVDRTLKTAVEQAGLSADKIEEAALTRLKDQAEEIVSDLKSTVSDLNGEAETAERKVEEHREFINSKITEHQKFIDNKITEHREAVTRMEQSHAEALSRDMELVNSTLKNAVEQAGLSADKIEEVALARLKDQAEEIVSDTRSTVSDLSAEAENAERKVGEHREFIDKKITENLKDFDSKITEQQEFIDSKITEHLEAIDNKIIEHREAIGSMEQSRAENFARDMTLVDITLKTAVEQAGLNADKIEEATLARLKDQAEEIVSDTRSTVLSLNVEAEDAERKVGEHREFINNKITEHREAVNGIDKARAAALTRDMELVNKTLKNAVEQAGNRADKMEEAALVKLKEQAKERIEKFKLAEDEKVRTYQENARSRVAEAQNIVKNFKDEWRTERQEMEAKEKTFKEESKKDIEELKNLAAETDKRISQEKEAQKESLEELKVLFGKTISTQEKLLAEAAEEMKLKALEITGTKLEEYRQVQDSEFQRLETLAEDSKKLDTELRRYMQETVNKINDEFSMFTSDSARERQKVATDFNATAEAIKAEMDEIEQGLGKLKAAAYENASEKIQIFENEFFSDLAKRSEEMARSISAWKDDLENKLVQLGADEEEKRSFMEQKLTTEIREELSARNDRIVSELDRLKSDAGAFEEGIREQMNAADITLRSYKDELDRDLEETREAADTAIKTEVASIVLSAADKIKQNQRELEGKLREAQEYTENRTKEIQDLLDASRRNISEQEGRITTIRSAMDDVRRDADFRRDEIFSRFDEQAKSVESGIRDAERQIKDFFDQAKIIDRTDELKREMERGIEDLRSDLDRLEQRRAEAAQLETQFAKIRRLEDDVNAKMSRFLSEQHRIEQMDVEFNRLVQISKAVEEKLKDVTASDDILQHIQLQIRKMGEAIGDTEEKYQRIENKNQILENTNDGIDRNFKELQKSEKTMEKIDTDLDRITEDISSLKESIETLASKSDKANEAVDQMHLLDTTLSGIEERITAMQTARAWIARAETRLEEINREILENIKLQGTVQREKSKKKAPASAYDDTPSPSIAVQENVVKLATQGWKVEEIAKTYKLSRSEVELILDTAPKE